MSIYEDPEGWEGTGWVTVEPLACVAAGLLGGILTVAALWSGTWAWCNHRTRRRG